MRLRLARGNGLPRQAHHGLLTWGLASD